MTRTSTRPAVPVPARATASVASARPGAAVGGTRAAQLLDLQRRAGNRVVQRLVSRDPVQRCAKDATCANNDPCPLHGPYSQATSTAFGAVRRNRDFIAQEVMDDQLAGNVASKDEIRDGVNTHEGIPADQSAAVTAQTKAGGVAAGIQSGLRVPTKTALLIDPADANAQAGAHSGFFPNNTGTGGQSKAHEPLRQAIPPGLQPVDQVLLQQSRMVASMANGPQILASNRFTGMTPTNPAFPGPIEATTAQQQQNRIRMAQQLHIAREVAKDRHATMAAAKGYPSRVSQPREGVFDDGTGGDALPGGQTRARSQPREFEDEQGTTAKEKNRFAANASAQLSESYWAGYTRERQPKQCPACGVTSDAIYTRCRACKQPLP
ncbi:MAG: hypothetical protein AB7G21_04660 [Dehalococcoidia bacterium]